MNRMKRFTHLPILLLLAGALLSGCDTLLGGPKETPQPVTAVTQQGASIIVEGHVVPRDYVDLFFTSGGEVAEVLVEEGSQVLKGEVLARLGDRQAYQAQVAAAELELTSAQQAYDDLIQKASLAYAQAWSDAIVAQQAYIDAQERLTEIDNDDYQQKIDDARKAVADAHTELNDAQDDFDKYADLDIDNTDRKNAENALQVAQDKYDQTVRTRDRLLKDLEQARAQEELTYALVEDAQRSMDARQDGPDPDDLALSEARLNNANAQLTAAQAALANLDMIAPFDGIIVKVDITPGETALPNRTVIVLADFSQWYVETSDLTENEVVSIQPGGSVLIVPDALPDLELAGKIETIDDVYVEKAGDITYTARILLAELDPRLRWGMTVEVRFDESGP